jgi:hypothetical protein
MNIQSAGLSINDYSTLLSMDSNAAQGGSNGKSLSKSSSGQAQLKVLSEKYSMNNLMVSYTSADGDSVSLSASSVDYQKAILTANGDTSSEDWQKIIDQIKDEYVKMKGSIVTTMFGGSDGKAQEVSDPRKFDESKAIPGLPEYWNAENTSQRIVDFATSFIGMFDGSDTEFVSMIKDAIEKGFSQAKDVLGNMPDEVSKLTDKTHALVMDKIDKWASDRAAAAQATGEQAATVSA